VETPIAECMLTTVGTLAIAVTPSTSGATDRAETQVTSGTPGTLTEERITEGGWAAAAQETTGISRDARTNETPSKEGMSTHRRDTRNSRDVNNIRDLKMLETPLADMMSTALEMTETAETLATAETPGTSTAVRTTAAACRDARNSRDQANSTGPGNATTNIGHSRVNSKQQQRQQKH
jgi:hypothetical protein